MPRDSDNSCHMLALPTEILLYIFALLPAKYLILCRQVCHKWRNVADRLVRSNALWRKYCKVDHSECYNEAAYKARPVLTWYQIYRSLALWSKFGLAKEIRDEFGYASNITERIHSCKILADGYIAVVKEGGVFYYDILTLELSNRRPLFGNVMMYAENDVAVVILDRGLQLLITRKVLNPRNNPNLTVDLVVTFVIANRDVYYANVNNEVFVCKLDEYILKSIYIGQTDIGIMTFSSGNSVNILTYGKSIYTVKGNRLLLACSLESAMNINLMHCLNEYQLLSCMDWSVYYEWSLTLNHPLPQGPLRDILVMKTYCDMVFVGCNCGVFLIYYKPYVNGVLDLLNSTPIKQYNFTEPSDIPVLTECPIRQIDIVEHEDGHSVLVAMPKKIVTLYFYHTFKNATAFSYYSL